MNRTVSITEARAVLAQLESSSVERYLVQRSGKPVGVILSLDDYEALQALVQLAQDPARLLAILSAHERVRAGDLGEFKELDGL